LIKQHETKKYNNTINRTWTEINYCLAKNNISKFTIRKLANNNGITERKYYISNVVNREKIEVEAAYDTKDNRIKE